jgi:hypothetical protein
MKLEIACPKCDWKPDGGAHWQCDCGHVWDTFSTGGRCPACRKVWQETHCPGYFFLGMKLSFIPPGGCGKMSPHLDWYRNLDLMVGEALEVALRKVPEEEALSPSSEFEK